MIIFPIWSKHAVTRRKKHGITEEQIADCWVYGIPSRTYKKDKETKEIKECWKIVGSYITLIISTDDLLIITMYPNNYREKQYEYWAKWNDTRGDIQGITFITEEVK